MSPAFSKAEHTVINVGGEEFPRLISCVKASQGFDWNQGTYTILYLTGSSWGLVVGWESVEWMWANVIVCVEIFLPSYADYHFDDLERRQDPVEDIIVTEEEVRKMFPQ